ncbi:Gamma-tocopherol methyltransferase, chloroplastic [Asimina triloba]
MATPVRTCEALFLPAPIGRRVASAPPLKQQRQFRRRQKQRQICLSLQQTRSTSSSSKGGLPRARAMAAYAEELSLRQGIADFYDESSVAWENLWGDHMHHGFYEPHEQALPADHRAAQIRMIEEALRFAGIPGLLSSTLFPVLSQHPRFPYNQLDGSSIGLKIAGDGEEDGERNGPRRIVDVGCGIGGSSRYLARKYGAICKGITLSPVQAQRAQDLAVNLGLGSQVSFQVADALQLPFPDGEFDLVWSMESGEHMPDKTKFVSELVRVAAPGATIIIVTWCHRDLLPSESLKPEEQKILGKICDAYYLPAWCSAADYVGIAKSLSLLDIRSADWSDNVAPFWPAVIRSALSWKGFTSLLRSGFLGPRKNIVWKDTHSLTSDKGVGGFPDDVINMKSEDGEDEWSLHTTKTKPKEEELKKLS